MSAEQATFWLSVLLYAMSVPAVVGGLTFRSERSAAWGWRLAWVAFAVHTASVVARWTTSGRLPYIHDYENILMGTWVVAGVYLAVGSKWRSLRPTGVVALPFILLSLGVGASLPAEITPVTAPYRSVWLGVHVAFAWFTYAAYTVCASLGLLEILKGGKASRHRWLERAPDAAVLRERTMRFVGYGFLLNGVMIASGAIWAHDLWGSYWQWDPVETWSLITWLAYGLYLHAWYTLGWRDVRLAWIALLALFGILMTFWGVQWLPSSYHLFRDIGNTMEQVGRPR